MQNLVLQKMAAKWPSELVARTEIERFTGGLCNRRTLANLDSMGKGPEGRLRVGRKICYPTSSVVRFLESRLRPVCSAGSGVELESGVRSSILSMR
jgi:hypothetical protein